MRICWKKCQTLGKKGLWIAFWCQLMFLCFAAVSIRNEETRTAINENLVQPFLNFKSNHEVTHNTHKLDYLPDLAEEDRQYKFQNFNPLDWKSSKLNTFTLPDGEELNTDAYFSALKNGDECFTKGTDFTKTEPETSTECHCLPDYYGKDCGIPDAVWHGHYKSNSRKKLKRREKSRRLVHALPVNHEFDFFETRIKMLEDVVDVFVIQESNYTTFGSAKELLFLDKLRKGWLAENQNEILWVMLPYFSEKGNENGWYADAFIRLYLSRMGLKLISNQREDDLFLLLDADELPLPEILLFLKLYDGYTEPIRFGFRWTVFGFYWLKAEDPGLMDKIPLFGHRKKERLLQLWVMCTLGMLKTVYSDNGMLLRRNVWESDLLKEKLKNYTQSGHTIKEWEIGKLGHFAGYHCSWCYSPEGIRTKLLSAQKHDKPRWGDYPEKTDLKYIADLIKTGGWFDDTTPYIRVNEEKEKKFYAPSYILNHRDKFRYLLELELDSDELGSRGKQRG